MNQDKTRAVTLEDLIRRYDLENLKAERKVIKTMATTIENQHTIIKQFVKNTSKYTKDQAKLTAWFFSGVPSLENEPFLSLSEDEKQNVEHLYYDRETGLVYRLEKDGGYKWTIVDDDSLAQSMAIANSDPDSQDNKRNVFYEQPTPPYAVGDIWIDNNVIMRCRCSRDGDEFKDNEWVEQKNYSESNVLLDVRAVLDSFIENVEKNYVTETRLNTTKNTIEAEVKAKLEGVSDEEGFVTVASLILAINGAESSAKINADKIALTATDILDLIANNEINLTSRNITIKSDNFQVDKKGNTEMSSAHITGGKLNINDDSVTRKDWDDPVITIQDEKFKESTSYDFSTKINSYGIKVKDYQPGGEEMLSSITAYDIASIRNYNGGFSQDNTSITPGNIDCSIKGSSTSILGGEITTNSIKILGAPTQQNHAMRLQDFDSQLSKHIQTGTCQLNQVDNTVYFPTSFNSPPKVLLQCTEGYGDDMYAAHIVSVTTTYFQAYVPVKGLNEYKNFYWVAIAE